MINKIADHDFHIVFGHFTLPSLQINSLQTLSPRATGHIYLRYTINTCVRSSFDTPVIMYHKRLWLRFNTNYISKSGYQSIVNLVGLVFATWKVLTGLVCKERVDFIRTLCQTIANHFLISLKMQHAKTKQWKKGNADW